MAQKYTPKYGQKNFFEIFRGEIFEIFTNFHFSPGIWTRDLWHPKWKLLPLDHEVLKQAGKKFLVSKLLIPVSFHKQ